MGFLDNLFEMFRGNRNGKAKRNNTASYSPLTSMQDPHVSMGEDPGALASQEDKEEQNSERF